MDGSAELLQLAHLLRVGAGAATDIAIIRPRDRLAIEKLAAQAMRMAEEFVAIVEGRTPSMLS